MQNCSGCPRGASAGPGPGGVGSGEACDTVTVLPVWEEGLHAQNDWCKRVQSECAQAAGNVVQDNRAGGWMGTGALPSGRERGAEDKQPEPDTAPPFGVQGKRKETLSPHGQQKSAPFLSLAPGLQGGPGRESILHLHPQKHRRGSQNCFVITDKTPQICKHSCTLQLSFPE